MKYTGNISNMVGNNPVILLGAVDAEVCTLPDALFYEMR